MVNLEEDLLSCLANTNSGILIFLKLLSFFFWQRTVFFLFLHTKPLKMLCVVN